MADDGVGEGNRDENGRQIGDRIERRGGAESQRGVGPQGKRNNNASHDDPSDAAALIRRPDAAEVLDSNRYRQTRGETSEHGRRYRVGEHTGKGVDDGDSRVRSGEILDADAQRKDRVDDEAHIQTGEDGRPDPT